MISNSNRFHGHSSLNYVYKNGQVARSRWLIIKAVVNPNRKQSRLAVIISKKVLKGAVKRNRVRRQIYTYASKLLPNLKNVYDIAIIVSSGELFTESQPEIFKQLDQVIDQLSLKK